MQKTIKIENGTCKMPKWRMAEPVNFELQADEHLAIVGPNGGGKSMFVDMLVGRHPLYPNMAQYDFSPSTRELVSDNIKYIAFRDTYGGDNDRTYFLQQRWNQMEIDKETPTAGQKLEEAFLMAGDDTPERRLMQRHLYEIFHMEHLLDKYIILLSSGELRKFKLASTLFSAPRILVMDNPFIGLDEETREQLKMLLAELASKRASFGVQKDRFCEAKEPLLQIILVLSKVDDIPDFITHVVEVRDLKVLPKVSREHYLNYRSPFPTRVLSTQKEQAIIALPRSEREYNSDEVVRMSKVSIKYGERIILKDLDWTVKKRRTLGFERAKRFRKVNFAEPSLCRQPAVVCLRHCPFRSGTRKWRNHLGHQETYRLCFARNAPFLSASATCHTRCCQRIDRFSRPLRKTVGCGLRHLPFLDGHVWIAGKRGNIVYGVVERRTTISAPRSSLCERSGVAHPRRTAARTRQQQPPTGERHHRSFLQTTEQDAHHGYPLQGGMALVHRP